LICCNLSGFALFFVISSQRGLLAVLTTESALRNVVRLELKIMRFALMQFENVDLNVKKPNCVTATQEI
jgi:hypothetical protein